MRYAKAIVAGIVTVGGTVAQALDDNHVSADELGGILTAAAVAVGLVWAVRNRTPVR